MIDEELVLTIIEKSIEKETDLKKIQEQFNIDETDFLRIISKIKKEKNDPVSMLQEKINELKTQLRLLEAKKDHLENENRIIEFKTQNYGGIIKLRGETKRYLDKAEETLRRAYDIQHETEKEKYEENKNAYHQTLQDLLTSRDNAMYEFYDAYDGLSDDTKSCFSLNTTLSLYKDYVYLKPDIRPTDKTLISYVRDVIFAPRDEREDCVNTLRLFLDTLRKFKQLEEHLNYMRIKGSTGYNYNSWNGTYELDYITRVY